MHNSAQKVEKTCHLCMQRCGVWFGAAAPYAANGASTYHGCYGPDGLLCGFSTALEEFADSMCMETESVVVKRIGSPSQFVFEERPLEDSSSEGEEDWDEDAGRPSKTEVGGGSTVPPGVSSSYHPPSNGFSNSPYFMGTGRSHAAPLVICGISTGQ